MSSPLRSVALVSRRGEAVAAAGRGCPGRRSRAVRGARPGLARRSRFGAAREAIGGSAASQGGRQAGRQGARRAGAERSGLRSGGMRPRGLWVLVLLLGLAQIALLARGVAAEEEEDDDDGGE